MEPCRKRPSIGVFLPSFKNAWSWPNSLTLLAFAISRGDGRTWNSPPKLTPLFSTKATASVNGMVVTFALGSSFWTVFRILSASFRSRKKKTGGLPSRGLVGKVWRASALIGHCEGRDASEINLIKFPRRGDVVITTTSSGLFSPSLLGCCEEKRRQRYINEFPSAQTAFYSSNRFIIAQRKTRL
mmetsp:Transcript_6156/g.8689  ORF Transcript_6156/g.8689 Transcript_6156/m.8689 type:complete len:185 (+) Transcript_6156:333-887(+)